MAKVYVWPNGLFRSSSYTDPNLIWTTPRWDGSPGQSVANVQRSIVDLTGIVSRKRADVFDVFVDRLRGGIALCAVLDYAFRRRNGWDRDPALDASGNEFWRADGRTATYNGEAANPPGGPWRSIFAAAVGSHAIDATSLSIDGLLAGEVIPVGCMIRLGDFRYRVATQVVADGAGAATVTLTRGLVAAAADDAPVRVPGDLFVGNSADGVRVFEADLIGNRDFSVRFGEVYADEVTGGFEWVVD